MSNSMIGVRTLAGIALGSLLFGCAAAPIEGDSALVADDDGLAPSQLIYNTNATGTWSASAYAEDMSGGLVQAYSNFTGPANQSRRFGVCALRQHRPVNGSPVACNSTADCNSAPTSLPAGGFRYCTAPNGVGTKYCFFRPGPATTYCAGTPANGNVPINVGGSGAVTLSAYAENVPSESRWIGYACFEGCAVSDPSSSSSITVAPPCSWVGNQYICQ
jgi:hypothetical protein